ncbi:MAG: Glucose/sorbosone dehydrogenase-like protein [Solirubrobacterales bacterium]|nr:Glucose/sorbosone dehydrogenase-like protein [Solirubrobacterales bacterium]
MKGARRALLLALGMGSLPMAAAAPAASAAVRLVQVGTASSPVAIAAAPGDTSRLYVAEQRGAITVLKGGVTSTFLDLSQRITAAAPDAFGERGLLGLAFAPDFATSRRFYVYFTARSTNAVTIARYTASSPDSAADATFEALVSIPHDQQANHNGGGLQFGPDGMLYAGTGDGGSGGDPAGNAQNLASSTPPVVRSVNHDPRLGKLLRLDVSPATGYAQPADNPFPAPARDVWAYGLRNPFRFSFDRQTGALFIGDVGQSAFEEIDAVPGTGRGLNYGWGGFEGRHTYPGGQPVASPPADLIFPVIEQTHDEGWCSVIGGYVVRDPTVPDLLGRYVYSDYCKNEIRSAAIAGGVASGDAPVPGLAALTRTTTFGEDAAGRVYVASQDNAIYRLEQVPGTGGPAPAPPAGTDRTPPSVTLAKRRLQHAAHTGRVFADVTCSERCAVLLRGRLLVGGRTLAGALRAQQQTVEAGVTARLAVIVTAPGRRSITRALKAGRRVQARLVIRATDAAGNRRNRVQTVPLAR